jgi:AcrR family transcriptional regulator
VTGNPSASPPRERILDAAFEVMRTRGLASATTKQIARAAGYSEAMLYKHFTDKQELFLAVLAERLPPVAVASAASGDEDVIAGLTRLVEQLMSFFTAAYPIAASVFSAPALLAEHRASVLAAGHGPDAPVRGVQARLEAEQAAGRVAASADCAALARVLVGAAFHQGFLAAFAGNDAVTDARDVASGIVGSVRGALDP